ncbi:FtsQ-type POTRA domain-containing protein [uncultured Psychrobacillus sp.]|uniref:cell division protein FtsQ/DivIB n=1 Tax=uncultured Psychrobacillus sp. TaxID=1551585 RepID=UPI00261C9223|nr:FtsQ-type POTRA domain-containing protein [uncultured Psychrobacillus sp.]
MEKVIDIEDRIPTLKEKRRRRTNKKFSILLFLFVFTLLVLLYFQSSYSQVQKIELDGAKLFSVNHYIEQSGLKIGDSMWSFKEKDIENSLEKSDWVESVQVKRKWLSSVHIEVKEFKQVGYVEKENALQIILENGKTIIPEDEIVPVEGPIIADFEDEKIRLRLIKELKKLNSEVLLTISQINYVPTENDIYSIQVFMNDGNEVQALIPSFSSKMNYYPSIISQINPDQKGVIDMEVGSYFEPFQKVLNETEGEEAIEDEEEESS